MAVYPAPCPPAVIKLTGNSTIHLDETLALETVLVIGHESVSWKENQAAFETSGFFARLRRTQ